MGKLADWQNTLVAYSENLKPANGEVVIYARVALDENNELKRQADELINKAEAIGDSSYAVFYESGSGLDEKRPEFLKMMEYVKEKKIKRLYIMEITRFSRNYIACDKIMTELMSLGVEVVV